MKRRILSANSPEFYGKGDSARGDGSWRPSLPMCSSIS